MVEPFDPHAYAEMMAKALELPLHEANHDEVARNLALAFRLAPLFLEFPLHDEAEPAPVFNALEART
ncbi:MAG: DUF4089 domain-containing protein [Rhizobiales bacterium]|nr:DUF4089 domain-containing protein [Hyphomicrobiales bacterium]